MKILIISVLILLSLNTQAQVSEMDSLVGSLSKKAIELLFKEEYDNAIEIYTKIIKLDTTDLHYNGMNQEGI